MPRDKNSRFARLIKLTPRRFHISSDPPFRVGLVMCGHVNSDDDNGVQFFLQRDGIRNCKPGIWSSSIIDVPEEDLMECVLRWVAPGSIDVSQSVENWEKYEKETRQRDLEAVEGKSAEEMVGKEAMWRRDGHYFSDGGICCVVSTEYLTREAYERITLGDGEVKYWDYGGYVETLSLSIMDGPRENACFCIGGMCFHQDAVGGPPRVSVAEENGQVVVIRIHGGEDEEDEEDEEED